MTAFYTWLKHEVETDYTAALYALCMVWPLALLRWMAGCDGVGLLPLTQIIFLAWAAAWFQQLLCLKGRLRPLPEAILWNAVPIAAGCGAAAGFGWLADCPGWALPAFCGCWAAVMVLWWAMVQWLCRCDTLELNTLLHNYRTGRP